MTTHRAGEEPGETLNRADQALYQAKKVAETRCKHFNRGVAGFPRATKVGETERGIGWRSLGNRTPVSA